MGVVVEVNIDVVDNEDICETNVEVDVSCSWNDAVECLFCEDNVTSEEVVGSGEVKTISLYEEDVVVIIVLKDDVDVSKDCE